MYNLIKLLTFALVTTNLGVKPASAISNNINNYISGCTVQLNNESNKDLILDLDMAGDIDDVCALRIATELDDENIIDLKMVALSVNGGDRAAKAVDGMLTHDKIDDVIIGTCDNIHIEDSDYWDVMGSHASNTYERIKAVSGYRKILAESAGKVDIVTTGYTFNIEDLIKSQPDEYSELNGVEMIKEKVGQLYITGGSYPDGYDSNFIFGELSSESASYVNDHWPLPIVYFINNQVNEIMCGDGLQRIDEENRDIVSQALRAWGAEHGRVAWDPYAVWCACYGLSEVCQSNIQRAVTYIDPTDGRNEFRLSRVGKNFLVFRNPYIENAYYEEQLDSILLRKYYKLYE